jgi:hypothetical protein
VTRCLPLALLCTLAATCAAAVVAARPAPIVANNGPTGTFQGRDAAWWAHRAIRNRREIIRLKHRWKPTVTYALRLASAVSGVPYTELRAVSWCESRHEPFAANGRYKGLFQLGWSPFGFSPFDPVANALSAALTVVHDGSWRQWACQPR